MNIDIEAIVRQEIRKLMKEHLNISNSVHAYEEVAKEPTITEAEEYTYDYEFPREGKTRRNAEEMALHKQEKILERRLTPEEKGEIKAKLHMDDSAENEAKEEAIKKARINKIAAEGMAAANKELAEESGYTEEELISGAYPENPIKYDNDTEEPEATIPKTEPINTPNSLFS